MYHFRNIFFLIFFLLISWVGYAQKSAINIVDSLQIAPAQDTIGLPTDSLQLPKDSLDISAKPTGDFKTEIKYYAEDSTLMEMKSQTVHLYKNAKVTYGDIVLEANYIRIDFDDESVTALPGYDTTGHIIGRPLFTQGQDQYYSDSMRYNFRTQKAIIHGVITKQGEGFLLGKKVKKNQYNELFVSEGRFCPCEDPFAGTYIKSDKIKVIPKKKILVGPSRLYISDVPTPLWLPFGWFPVPREKLSGIRVPSYGEEQRRGFFLRDGGYYWAINDYMDLDLLGSIYTKGDWGLNLSSTYKKRYRYSGRFNVSFEKVGQGNLEDNTKLKTFWVRWNHSPQSRGSSRFSASVNLGSSSYTTNVVKEVAFNTRSTFSSNVSYSKTFTGTPFSMTMGARHSQNIATGIVDVTLPDLSISMSSIQPFKRKVGGGSRWYEKIKFSYNFVSQVQLSNNKVNSGSSFKVVDENPQNDDIIDFKFNQLLFDRAKIGATHRIPVSTSIKLFKYFSLNPSFNYTEWWYPKRLDYEYLEDEKAMRVDTVSGFSRAYEYNGGVSLTTNIYGMYNFKKGKRIQAIRHTIRPSLSFSMHPDFAESRYGFYQNRQVDEDGREQLISRYRNIGLGRPGTGKSGSISFSVSNNLEMKALQKNDTTGKAQKISLIDNFSFSTSYNLAVDSFNLSNFSFSLRTKLFKKKLDISTSASINPYIYELTAPITLDAKGKKVVKQRLVDKFAWTNGDFIGQVTSVRLSVGTSLNPKARGKDNKNKKDNKFNSLGFDPTNLDPDIYVDFDMPWNLRISYTLNYGKRGFEDSKVTQGVRFSGNVKLTPKWNVRFSSGYDIDKKEFTQTQFNIARDINCWTMAFNWTPFGRFTSYSFTYRIKSALLSDLKYEKNKSFRDLR